MEGKTKRRMLVDIQSVLPNINAEQAEEVIQKAAELGVTSTNQLVDLAEGDLNMLAVVQARRLVRYWKHKYQESDVIESLQLHNSTLGYNIDWKRVPEKFMNLLENGQTLSKPNRCEFVRLIVDDVIQKRPNTKRSFFKALAKTMVHKYPLSLQDKTGNSSYNYSFLAAKLSQRFDEKLRSTKKTEKCEAPNLPAAYGCIKWRLMELPEGETQESLLEKKSALAKMFEMQRRSQWDWKEVDTLMATTYGLLRKDINSQSMTSSRRKGKEAPKTTKEIADEWPFLFQKNSMIKHFKTLTGVDYQAKLAEFMTEYGEYLLQFLEEKSTQNKKVMKKVRRAIDRKTCADPILTGLFLMVMKTFKENRNVLLQSIEATTGIDEVDEVATKSDTPCVISLGSPFKARKFYFMVDGYTVSAVKSFGEALGLLFTSYFVLNIRYPIQASETLDFVQRVMMGMNPEKGTKKTNAGKTNRKSQISDKLQALNEEYMAFLEKQEENEDGN